MYHVVWIPRYRHKVLVTGVAEYLLIKLDEVRKWYPDIEYVERNVQPDHIHLVISFPPKYSISKVVQILKSNTSRAMMKKFDFLRNRYYGRPGMWSVGYFVSTVGLDEEIIKRYVKYQESEDRGQAKLELAKVPRT
jgi:putative transposase